jgi:probable rRNA maturation factor
MIQIDVTATVRAPVPRALLARAAASALRGRATLSIAVVGDARMRRLNREALGHDYVTDVLSFDHGSTPEGRLLEVLVCAPHAARQARSLGIPYEQELARYVIHGCLHLAGYDDRTDALCNTMWKRQERLVRGLFARNKVNARPRRAP